MDLKDYLTNEKISKKFTSLFELVNYSIKLASNMIMTGRDSRVKTDAQSRAMQVLNEILNDKDQFDEIIHEEVSEEEVLVKNYDEGRSALKGERKKSRKILAE